MEIIVTPQKQNKPVLPDFTRWAWAGPAARAWFHPLVREASNAFIDLERLSVIAGLRKAAFQFVDFNDVPKMSEWAASNGLVMVPITTSYTAGYTSTGHQKRPPNALRVVYTKMENYTEIFPFSDDRKIGTFLGFPTCCQDAFSRTWGQKQVDSTYEQFAEAKQSDLQSTPYSHTLLRWMGIRLVSHMPCHHHCRASQEQAEAYLNLGMKSGYMEEMLFISEMMKWPVRWSRLFGIAEIVTPAVKISTRTDWTATKDAFEKQGSYLAPEAHWWTDNGYSNSESMRHAHKDIILTMKDRLPENARVLDLGCGNGMLLRRLKLYRPDIKIAGVDINKEAIGHAPFLSGKWKAGKIQDVAMWRDFNPDAVLFMPGRLSEMTPEESTAVIAALHGIQIYFYQYADWKVPLISSVTSAGWDSPNLLVTTPRVEVALSS